MPCPSSSWWRSPSPSSGLPGGGGGPGGGPN